MSRHNRYNNYEEPQAEKPTAYDKLKPYLTRTNIAVSAFMLIAIISFGLLYIQGVSTNCQNPISYYLYCNTIPSYEMNAMQWISHNIAPTSPDEPIYTNTFSINYIALAIAVISIAGLLASLYKYRKAR
jgi:hypothetical protein